MLIFGYDKFINDRPTTNAFEFKDGVSPINLGYAGYNFNDNINIRHSDLHLLKEKCSPCHSHHSDILCNFFDIEVKQINEIKDKYYYIIDVYAHEFWTNPDARYPNISKQAIKDVKKGKSKILILFPCEHLRSYYDVSSLLNTWVTTYDLPHRSIVLNSGNYTFKTNNKYIVYIPFCMWEHDFRGQYRTTYNFSDAIQNKLHRDKVFLNYNRRARYPRCKLVYELKASGVLNSGFVSLGQHHIDLKSYENIPSDFFSMLPLTFDDTNLEATRLAGKLVAKDFLNSYISLVSETSVEINEVFLTEKILKPIISFHPFIVLASPGFLEQLRKFGYKTFLKWFDESYDLEIDLDKRINMIVKEINKLVSKTQEELQNMLIDMLPTLKHNVNTYLKRSSDTTFQKQLEEELWK